MKMPAPLVSPKPPCARGTHLSTVERVWIALSFIVALVLLLVPSL